MVARIVDEKVIVWFPERAIVIGEAALFVEKSAGIGIDGPQAIFSRSFSISDDQWLAAVKVGLAHAGNWPGDVLPIRGIDDVELPPGAEGYLTRDAGGCRRAGRLFRRRRLGCRACTSAPA